MPGNVPVTCENESSGARPDWRRNGLLTHLLDATERQAAMQRTYDVTALPERIRSRLTVDPDTRCWLWTGPVGDRGYAQLWHDGRNHMVHRLVRELLVGPIPARMTLDHRCHTKACTAPGVSCPHRRCCNPAHTVPMDRGQNAARFNREKATCPRGHAYSYADGRGWRKCTTCQNEARRARRRARGLSETPSQANARKTHCLRGHALTGANLIERTYRGRPRRECVTCAKIRRQTHYERTGR